MFKTYTAGVTAGVLISANSTTVTLVSVNPTVGGKAYLVDGIDATGKPVIIFIAAGTIHGDMSFANGCYFQVVSGTWEVAVSQQ